jgi:hypothetical protein
MQLGRGAGTQPPLGASHVSHGAHVTGAVPAQTPPWQVPLKLHALPAQLVPFATKMSAGQAALKPPQTSATSHAPVAARHDVPAVASTSDGQAGLAPVQVSARSHGPAAARQVVVAAAKPSAGQALLVPSQLSATSQAPAAGRQTPVRFVSAGQVVAVPEQVSAWSQEPAAARQVVPAFPAGWVQAPPPLQTSRVQGLLSLAHAASTASNRHVAEQQSPPTVLPSSHCSAPVTTPLPQTLLTEVVVVLVVDVVVVVGGRVVVVPMMVVLVVDVVVVVVVGGGQLTQQGSVGRSVRIAGGVLGPVTEGAGAWR